MSAQFSRYPASSDSIRAIARRSSDAATSIDGLHGDVDRGHRAALTEAEGDLHTFMGPMLAPFKSDASQVSRQAIWASCQLELFADAIDVYNETSTDPRSINKLNAAADDLEDDGLRRGHQTLLQEKERLDADLDDAANAVARNLDRKPSNKEILREWKAGNLPLAAIGAWPGLGLKLTDLPTLSTNTAITVSGLRHISQVRNLSDKRLAGALVDPELNLSVREAILKERPGAIAILSRNWKLSRDMSNRADWMCRPNSQGQIVGPDGRLYNVTVPGEAPKSDPDVPKMSPLNDNIPDDGTKTGWKTLGSRDGEIAFGEKQDWADHTAHLFAGLAGTGNSTSDWQSIGKDHSLYVRMNDGSVALNDGTGAPNEGDHPPLGPVPDSMVPKNPDNRWDKSNNGTFLLLSALEGRRGPTV